MRIQLWSYNYDPEPTGIGPVSRTWAHAMRGRGHEIHVVAAHPHYPAPVWGSRRRPYREVRDGIEVTRLPLWIGRGSASARLRQEASFAAWQTAYLPMLGGVDAVVAVSPCFPALAPAILNRKLRRRPLVLWVQDILPDGAVSTGIMRDGWAIRAAQRLETASYRAADGIVVISDRFKENLMGKGVPEAKVARIYNPATMPVAAEPRKWNTGEPPRVLVMGNIGHSQALPAVVRAFEHSPALARLGARLVITGTGVAEEEVKASAKTNRVEILGVVSDDRLAQELGRASIGLVSQRNDHAEFNMPSKVMNYMASGLPVVAFVGPSSEVAELVHSSGFGAVVDSGDVDRLGQTMSDLLSDHDALCRQSENCRRFARDLLGNDALARRFEEVISGGLRSPS
ncbi:MAG: glycosyltransferase family 4 protein [Solirubrobacterales bacterium]